MFDKNMITKTVIKDYVSKRCPYLAFLELEDKSLVKLLEKSNDNREKFLELAEDGMDDGSEENEEKILDLVDLFKDYPSLKAKIRSFDKYKKKNKAEEIIEKYNDDQIVSKLSRTYFESKYGKENCIRCDVDGDGSEIVNEEFLSAITKSALLDKTKKVIFEPQIEHQDLRARADILIRNDDNTFSLVEVKGTNDVFKHPSKDGRPIYEVDTGIKDKYLYDMLFQYMVYTWAGLNITSVAFMFSSRDFRLHKETYPLSNEELDDFFVLKNIINLKEGAMSLIEYFDGEHYVDKNLSEEEREDYLIEGLINTVRQIGKLENIKPEKKYRCCKGPVCPFIEMCFGEKAVGNNSVFKLTKWGSMGGNKNKTENLLANGIEWISDIVDPGAYKFNEMRKEDKRSNAYSQILYQKGQIKEKYIFDMSLVEKILKKDYMNENIDYLLFFDFESFQYPIPLVKDSASWKQVVSQYSMHVVKKGYDLGKHDFAKGVGGDVTHFEYIADPDITKYENPNIELYETLKTQLEKVGIDPYAKNYRVVVFNKSFEQGRMKDFIENFSIIADPTLINFVRNFRENVVDLLDFVTSGSFYSRDFNGRGSLKVVQPTLGADKDVINYYNKLLSFDFENSLDYHKGDKCLVYNGGICLDLYKSLVVRSHLGGQQEGEPSTKELLDEALAYCKIDSWGTVIIYDVIKNVYLGKLKLDACYK